MASSLISALGGLRAHQGWIDVIGNNLANANTPGFKASVTTFSDLLSRKIRSATPPTANAGGTNPVQIGLGVQVSHVGRNMNQGSLNLTGRTFDLALSGTGFFGVTDGVNNLYSRVGTFGLDGDANVVDVRTGYQVLDLAGQPITLDIGTVRPPIQTSAIGFAGNLPKEVEGPVPHILEASSTFYDGTAAQLTGTGGVAGASAPGEVWEMEIIANGGAPQTVAITIPPGGLALTDVETEINTNPDITGVTASIAGGVLVLTSTTSGDLSSIKVNSGSPNDLAAEINLPTSIVNGTQTEATLTTDMNQLVTNTVDYVVGDQIDVSGTTVDGQPVGATFTYGVDGTTIGEMVTFIDGLYADATASYDAATGRIQLEANDTGESLMSLVVADATGNTGATTWAQHAYSTAQAGMGPDTVITSTEVYDAAGTSHIVTFRYERQDDGSWSLFPEVDPDDGTVLTPELTGIQFGLDGSLLTHPATPLSVQFNGQAAQSINIDFGSIGDIDGLTQFGGVGSVVVDDQDGSPAGQLASLTVDQRGDIIAFFTNGETENMASIGIVTFTNQAGLEASGDNYYAETPNSGQRRLSSGMANGAGEVISGALEDSNVDTAEEFVRLIQAQRGFQANARVITIQDEMFAEVVRII